jgi:hypothetical protein
LRSSDGPVRRPAIKKKSPSPKSQPVPRTIVSASTTALDISSYDSRYHEPSKVIAAWSAITPTTSKVFRLSR